MKEKSNFHNNYNLFFDGLQLARENEDRTEHMNLHTRMGNGSIQRFVPRFDLEVVISEYEFHQTHHLNIVSDVPMVELTYCIQGARETNIGGDRHELLPGSCTLQFINEVDASFEFSANQPFLMLGIGIPVATFHHFMGEVSGSRSVDFLNIVGNKSFRTFQETIDPSSSILLDKILKAARSSVTKNIEMECNVLELLSSAFRSFLCEGKSESTYLSKSDVQKIQQAREIMLNSMAEPPTLLQLSHMIALNDYKLKVGFKEIYGATVFGYLRDKRLEKALLLLQQGNITVGEVSCAVGYSNPSYFAEAFREKYGVNPGEFVRRSSMLFQH